MNQDELRDMLNDAFEAGWKQHEEYAADDAECRAERLPVGPPGMKRRCDDYVDDVMYCMRRGKG